MSSCAAIRTNDTLMCGPCGRQWDVGEPTCCPNAAFAQISDNIAKLRPMPALSRQEGGAHYKSFPVQPVEYALMTGMDFAAGSILKHIVRWRSEKGAEDLRQAIRFVELRRDLAAKTVRPVKPGLPLMTINEFITRNRIDPDDGQVLRLLDLWIWSDTYNMKMLAVPGGECHRDNLPALIIETIEALMRPQAVSAAV